MNAPPHTDSFSSSTLETPKSALKSTKSADALETIAIDGDSDKNDKQVERKEAAKIKFVQMNDDNEHDQNYHTPISFKVNKFMMCFKSEPDLSRVQNVNENEPVLNRGRFIAKKLLSGVSMINLRRPFANSNEKANVNAAAATATSETKTKINAELATQSEPIANDGANHSENTSIKALEVPSNETEANKPMPTAGEVQPMTVIEDVKIEDDDEDFVDDEEVDREYDDSVDKENRSPIQCNTMDYIAKLKSQPSTAAIGCNTILSDSMTNDSVSPITKSTHRMSKAMQVREL